MTLLILEMLLALAVIVGIMVWTLKTRTDTPVDALEKPQEEPQGAPLKRTQETPLEKSREAAKEPSAISGSSGVSHSQDSRKSRVE